MKGSSRSLRVVPSLASLWCKVLPFLRNQAVIISLELIFGGQAVGCAFPREGEEAIGQGKRGRHRGEEGGVSVTLSARRRDLQSPTGSQSTHWRSDPPRQNYRVPPESALTSEPAQLAAPGASQEKCAPPADARSPSLLAAAASPQLVGPGRVTQEETPLRYKVS